MPTKKPIDKAKSAKKPKLTTQDEQFVDKVAKGVAASRAYVEVGHKSTKNNRKSAGDKLRKPHIQQALEERKAYFRSIADVEAKDIIGAQQEIAFASIEDALDESGRLDFNKARENGSAKLIKKIARQQTQYGENVTVEFYSRTDALSQLADMLGLKQAPRQNEADLKKTVDALREYLERFPDADREQAIDVFSKGRNVPREAIASQLGTIG